jgi:transglutaminase-like putative cysteine protease
MGKASSFAALCRAAGIPARIGFQQLDCPDKPFMSEEVRRLWGDHPLPWHSLGEAYLNGRWLKLDATIHSEFARAWGRDYSREFDGEHDIPTVEGPSSRSWTASRTIPRRWPTGTRQWRARSSALSKLSKPKTR